MMAQFFQAAKMFRSVSRCLLAIAVLVLIVIFALSYYIITTSSIPDSNTTNEIYFPSEPLEEIQSYGQCNTPKNQRGLCIDLLKCPNLYNLLLKQPLTDADKQFLKLSQCGSAQKTVLVCCENRQIRGQVVPVGTSSRVNVPLPIPGRCGPVFQDRIIGGTVAKIDEYPWMALIEYREGDNLRGHQCGGSLITERYVLTAAHCIDAIPPTWKPFRVRLGEWDTSTDVDCEVDLRGNKDCSDPHIDVDIEKITVHPNYQAQSKNQYADIALIRLNRNVPFTNFIKPICLPVRADLKTSSFVNIVMDVAGWGRTENGTKSDKKLKTSVAVVDSATCQNVYSQQNVQLISSQLCAGGKQGYDSCRGDSGGPLIGLDKADHIAYYYISGVVSFGPNPCGLEGWPGVYTRVSDYLDWITQTMTP